MAARVIPLFEQIVGSASGNLLIIGHSGVNKVILCHILGMPLEHLFRIRQDYCCLNVIENGREGVRLCLMNMACPPAQQFDMPTLQGTCDYPQPHTA